MAFNRNMYRRQGQMTVVRGETVGPTVYDYFPRLPSLSLGSIQLVCGLTLVGLCIASLVTGAYKLASGFDAAIWAILAGSFSIAAGRTKTSCKIAADLVLSIMSAAFSGAGFVVVMTAIGNYNRGTYFADGAYLIAILESLILSCSFVIAIAESIIACHFSCLCCKNCCCNFDVTKTQQLLIYDNPSWHPDQTELVQVLSVPVSASSVQYTSAAGPDTALRMASHAVDDSPPPEYKHVVGHEFQ